MKNQSIESERNKAKEAMAKSMRVVKKFKKEKEGKTEPRLGVPEGEEAMAENRRRWKSETGRRTFSVSLCLSVSVSVSVSCLSVCICGWGFLSVNGP